MSDKYQNIDLYIVQLAEDMRHSANNLPDPNVISEFDEESLPEELKMFADVERYIHGEEKPVSFITGIATEKLPPVDKLNDSQITFLYDEIIRLLAAYGFYADFPEGLPVEIKYRLLRKKWDENTMYTGGIGMVHFEFCYYEPSECPFPEQYCSCKDFDDEDLDMNFPDDPDALPF